MKELSGFSASPGIAIGRVCLYSADITSEIPHYGINGKQIEPELRRADRAFKTALESLENLKKVSENLFGKQGEEIIGAHLAILKDPGLKKKIQDDIRNNRVNAEHAVFDTFEDYTGRISGTDHFRELTHDIRDVRDRLLESFGIGGGKFSCPAGERQPVIVAADILSTSVVVNIDHEKALAFIVREGGYTSHASILARTRNIPVVFGINVEDELSCRCKAVVDGNLGKVFVDPDENTRESYRRKQQKIEKRRTLCKVRTSHPAATAEGERIHLKVNISELAELELLKSNSADGNNEKVHYDGVGLLRTEFIFLKDAKPPSEEEQYKIYSKILDSADGSPVTVRLLDISKNKVPSYIHVPSEVNLDLDLRGARAAEIFKKLYLVQVRALLRAAVNGELKLLFPMIADVNDLRIFKNLVNEAADSLKEEKISFKIPACGIMFETPSAAVLARELLEECDFASIGTNDLLQYSTAASRENVYSQRFYHIMHPSVLKLMKNVVDAAKKINKEVVLCGELSSFENYYPVLLDLGLRSFSVPVFKFEDIKCELLYMKTSDYQGRYDEYLKESVGKKPENYFRFQN